MPLAQYIKDEILAGKGRFVQSDEKELRLDLSNQGLTNKDIAELVTVCRGKNIVSIDLERNSIGDTGAELLANNFPQLRILNLKQNSIKDNGAIFLSKNKALVELNVCDNNLKEQGIKALKSRFGEKVLVDGNPGVPHSPLLDKVDLGRVMAGYVPLQGNNVEVEVIPFPTSSPSSTHAASFWKAPALKSSSACHALQKDDKKNTRTKLKHPLTIGILSTVGEPALWQFVARHSSPCPKLVRK